MGVQNLWDLLSPVGRRVSVETLAGKRLAIDASIWMVQFMKAMRDERGEMVRNAHLLGFFRRICKLLFLRTKPVFVFDGGTPELKWRTVSARRMQRENAQTKIRKTAEKLLLNQLKKMKLQELAKELEVQRIKKHGKGKDVAPEAGPAEKNDARPGSRNQEKIEEELAKELEVQRAKKYVGKGKNVAPEAGPVEKNDARAGSLNQEMIDEMLAASLAAEEYDMHNAGASTSSDAFHGGPSTSACANFMDDEEDEDEDEDDEEMILPMTNGKIDPTVLAALPPSMQLDLLTQMRERLMAENRQKYQKVKKAPQKFSELQIEAYLKTVAFRREIDEVQKAASGKGVGGLQTARIASEGNKEFIFSSSFTGDKDVLASAGMRNTAGNENGAGLEHSSTLPTTVAPVVTPSVVSVPSGNEAPASSGNEIRKDFGSDVQTYRDERGHMRVSRLRAMGIRMTRDLQRNLDLMKEMEQDTISADVPANAPFNPTEKDAGNIKIILDNFSEISGEKSLTTEKHDNSRPMTNIGTSLEISFEDDGQCIPVDNDDDFFARLVAGDPVPMSSIDHSVSKDQNLESESDCEWEDGITGMQIEQVKSAANKSQVEEISDDETELQWEDEISNIPGEASSVSAAKSRGSIEEEAALQEAIARSLEDLKGEMDASNNLERSNTVTHQMPEASLEQDIAPGMPKSGSIDISISRTGLLDDMAKNKSVDIACSPGTIPMSSTNISFHNIDMAMDRPCEIPAPLDAQCSNECGTDIIGEIRKTQSQEAIRAIEKSDDALLDAPCESSCGTLHSHVIDVDLGDPVHLVTKTTSHTDGAATPIRHSSEAPDISINLDESKEPASDASGINRTASKEDLIHGVEEREIDLASRDYEEEKFQDAGAHLEDEFRILDEEYTYLKDEQRKLERNAASTNKEMFVECQELLQMFGLPYIIAPMEAEAQCAYMELTGLVDGVVTDDSDAFLFGARSVYKNIFDDRKYVEAYLMKDIEDELGLSREKLICMALLLGSDYTEGISGIGIVNAIEVLNAFPEENGLSKFREWVESPDPTILGVSGMTSGPCSKKGGSKSSDTSMNVSKDGMDVISSDCDDHEKTKEKHELEKVPKITQTFMDKHRKVSKNWHIPLSFPSQAVISAYASPQVDESTDPCAWGKPDHFALRRLCGEKLGWASQKADEVLLPVLKEYNKCETQLRMEAFYTFNERFSKIRSKRIKQAVKGITGKSFESSNDPKVGGKRNKRKNQAGDTVCGKESPANVPEEPRKNKTRKKNSSSKKEQTSDIFLEKGTGSRGDARATTRGRRKAQDRGRGKRKRINDIEFSDAESSDNDQELQFENIEAQNRVRRSTRSRKAAKYAESDDEVNCEAQSISEAAEEEKLGNEDFGDGSACYGEMEQSTAGDTVPDDGLCGDYMLKGGGFCADGDELENDTDTLQDDSTPVEVDTHHLQTGGGLCADEDEPENETDTLQDDSALVEFDRHHLQTGGGFCADEDEPENEADMLQDDSAPGEVDRHYLQTGGGFCFDDDDTDHDLHDHTHEETEGVILRKNEDNVDEMCSSTPSQGALDSVTGIRSSNLSDLQQHQQTQNETAFGSLSQLGKAMPEVKDDTKSSMKGLSAMPNLRRKRKKSS